MTARLPGSGDGDPADAPSAETVVDARGLRCPIPVIRLAQASAGLPAGSVVTVWSTDPAAVLDVPAWARMRGHTVVESRAADGGHQAITVRLGG